jgi:hypothetical protein
MRIRGASIAMRATKRKLPENTKNELEHERVELAKKLAKNPSCELFEMYANIKREMEAFNNECAKGMQIRAKCKHIELNEHST